jgi:hypothetical protein
MPHIWGTVSAEIWSGIALNFRPGAFLRLQLAFLQLSEEFFQKDYLSGVMWPFSLVKAWLFVS